MQTSRRDFIAGFGGFAFGIAGTGLAGASPEAPATDIPWPYELLDVEETRKRGHKFDYATNCASGAFCAIVSQLREKAGFPWTTVPLDIYAYAGGGVGGWGTLCGGLNGAAGAITLVVGKKEQGRLVNELMSWYTGASFPSEESNRYAREHTFLVDKYLFAGDLPRAVPTSPLCHVSVAKWCEAAGVGAGSPERSERCARLCGDVAAKAVELLNAWKKGAFTPVAVTSTEDAGCLACHAPKDPTNKNGVVGRMHCTDCHDPHE